MRTNDDSTDALLNRAEQQIRAVMAELEPQRDELERRLKMINGKLLTCRAALAAVIDDSEDASAIYRQPGALAHRSSPEARKQMAQAAQSIEQMQSW